MQVGLRGRLVDGQDSVDNVGRQLGGQSRVELGRKGCPGDIEEKVAVDLLLKLELVKELILESALPQPIQVKSSISHLQSFHLGDLEAISDDSGVQTLGDITVGLLEQLSHQQHHRCRSVTANVVLGGRSSRNHDSRRVLDLHLSQEDVSILGKLDLLVMW